MPIMLIYIYINLIFIESNAPALMAERQSCVSKNDTDDTSSDDTDEVVCLEKEPISEQTKSRIITGKETSCPIMKNLPLEVQIKNEDIEEFTPVEIRKEIKDSKQHFITRLVKCIEVGCNWTFKNVNDLNQHLNDYHEIRLYRCLQKGCKESFDSK
jgi:hypothetical protein